MAAQKLGASATLMEALFCARTNFPAAKKAKSASKVRKALPKRLLRRLVTLFFVFLTFLVKFGS